MGSSDPFMPDRTYSGVTVGEVTNEISSNRNPVIRAGRVRGVP
jgi:hypothetical protein